MKHHLFNFRRSRSTLSPLLLPAVALCLGGIGTAVHADQSAALVAGSVQDFEGGGLGFTLTGGFGSGGDTDYWEVIPNDGTRVKADTIQSPPASAAGVFDSAGPTGGNVLAGDDTNAPGGASPVAVTFDAVTVSGLTNLSVNVLLAATNPTQGTTLPARGFEATDRVTILVSYDGGGFTTLANYLPAGGGSNVHLSLNGAATSGADATDIEQGFKNFSHALTPAGTVQIKIEVRAEATREYVAIDNFRICGDLALSNAPVLAGIEGSALNYTEGDGASQVTNAISVSDSDSATLSGGTVTISSNNTPSEDELDATGVGLISVAGNGTGTLTLSGVGTLAEYQQVLRSVTYTNTNVLNPNTAQRTVQFQVTDDLSNNSNLQSRNINVANTIQTFTIPHTESFDDGLGTGDRYEVIGGFDVGANDFFRQLPSGDATTRFAIPITGVVGAGFFGGEDIDQNGEVDGGKVVVCLSATGLSSLEVQVLLAAAASNPFELTDGLWVEYQMDGGAWQELIAFRPVSGGGALAEDTTNNGVGDGTALTAALTNHILSIPDTGNVLKVRVRALNSTIDEEIAFDELKVTGSSAGPPPVLSNLAAGPVGYTEGDGAVVISSTATIADSDDTDMESATVEISSNYVNGEDVLSFTPSGGITGIFATGTGILSLNGTASLAAYETVLKSVTYENTNLVNPSQNNRTARFRVNDGDSNSNAIDIEIVVLDLVSAQPLVAGQHCESFETDGLGTRYAANSFDLPPDFFKRESASFGGLSGTNADGVSAFVGKDTSADGNAVHSLEIIVDTSNHTDLMLDLKLAAVANQFEVDDEIVVERESDGGGFVTLVTFAGTGTNSDLTNGMLTLGPDFTDLSTFTLPDADETRIRVSMNTSATPEETAVDNICITGTPTDPDPPVADLADPANGGSIFSAPLNTRGYIDVTFTDIGSPPSGLDVGTITDAGAEFTLTGAAAAGVTVNGAATDQGGGVYRYTFTGSFSPGVVGVDFTAGSFADQDANPNLAETEGFTVDNSPPTADPETVSRGPGAGIKIPFATLLDGDVDPDTGDNTGLSITGVTYPASGEPNNGASVSLTGDGRVAYEPAPGFNGTDKFEYTVQDSGGATATGTVTVNTVQDPGGTSNITVEFDPMDGTIEITAAGIPGRTYELQKLDAVDMVFSSFGPPVTTTADALGRIFLVDPTALPPTRMYRVIQK